MNTTAAELKAGMRVQVDAHGQHEEDFSGIIREVDNDNYIVHVEAPDGELYGCTMAFVREWPEEATAISSHTPGPWSAQGFGIWSSSSGENRRVACSEFDRGDGPYKVKTEGEAVANARLMAAAPELLEALKEAAAMLRPIVHKMSIRAHFSEKNVLANVIEKAIAKAEGK